MAQLQTTPPQPQVLNRAISFLGNVAITLSDISPTTGVFLMIPAVLALAGTGAFWAYLVAGCVSMSVAVTMGELGSLYPIAGGLYSIITRVLGKPVGFLALVDYLGQAIFLPATVAFGSASYIVLLAPSLNVNVVAMVVMALSVLITVFSIKWNANFTGFFLILELVVVGLILVASLTHISQPLTALFHPVQVIKAHGLSAVSIGVILAAVTVSLFTFNGFDSAINFSEETTGNPRNVGRAVVSSALTGILAQFIPMVALILTAPNIAAFLSNGAPVAYIGALRLGSMGGVILNVGAAIAMFNCTIAVTLQFSRVIYSSGRDRAWPDRISRALSSIHPTFHTPWIATLTLGAISIVLLFFSSLLGLITFTAVLIVALYVAIAVALFVSRTRHPHIDRPFKAWLYPLTPALVIIGGLAALSQQTTHDLFISAAIFAAGLIYYVVFLRPRKDTHWVTTETPSGEAKA